MSALDGPPVDGAPVPAKKSLRSKRLMRPVKNKAGPAPESESEQEPQDRPQDEPAPQIAYDKDAGSARSSRAYDTNRHSGTDTETLAADVAQGQGPSPRLPPVDKSVSGMSFSSADADMFVEAADTQTSSRPASRTLDGTGFAANTDHPPTADDEPAAASADDLMQMLAGLQRAESPRRPSTADAGTADLLGGDFGAQPRGVSSPVGDSFADDLLGGLASSYVQPDAQESNPVDAEGDARGRRQSHGAVASPVAWPEAGDSVASPVSDRREGSADHTSRAVRRSASAAPGQGRRQSAGGLDSEIGQVVSPTDSVGSPSGGSGRARDITLGRSASLRQGARSPDQRSPAGISPTGSAAAKKTNRRSILLTSFVPPVGLGGGGPGAGSSSRSSADSHAESVVETPADSAALNGVVEISPGGKVSKRSSFLDSQRTARPTSDASMTSIRLRPSAEVAAASQQHMDVKSVAKSALQSISERIGGTVAIKEEDDEDEDADLPEWMKEVQRRKRAAQEKEEADRAAAAAAAEARAEALERALEPSIDPPSIDPPSAAPSAVAQSEPAPEPAELPDPVNASVAGGEESPKDQDAGSKDDDDMPLMDIDLGGEDARPLQALPAADVATSAAGDAGAAVVRAATGKDKPLPPPAAPGAVEALGARPAKPVPVRSIYRSLSASLGINQPAHATDPARQSGPQLPTVDERQRASSQASGSPSSNQGGLFAAVTSFFGRVSTQQSAPPSAAASVTTAPPGLHSNMSSSSNLSRGTLEFPGMRPSNAEGRGNGGRGGGDGSPEMDMLLSQLEAQNQQILKDRKARVFAHEAPNAPAQEGGADSNVDWEFWGSLINNYDKVTRAEPRKLAQSVYLGIPSAVRGTVWQLMAKSRSDPELGAKFHRLVAQKTEPGSEEAKHEKQIRHDLARTFPKLEYFRDANGAGQEGLYNVLRAYALFDPEVGYCQGLSFVVGPLLLNMPDEEAFCLLVRLMHTYGLRGHFLPSMDDLQLRLYQFEHVLRENLPWLSRHFQEQGIMPTMYVSQWLMTMFAYRLPIELTFRLFDVVFAEGLDCLVRVALAVLKRSQTRLLSLEFEAIMQYLNDGPLFAFYSHAAPDMLVRDANLITSVNARHLERLRRQYIDEMQRRMEEEDEGNRIRVENQELREECARLRAAIQDVTAAHEDMVWSQKEVQAELEDEREEAAHLRQVMASLKAKQPSEQPAVADLQDDVDRLAEKNVQLTVKNQQLEDSLQDLEEALIQIKTLYAESENQRELMTKKFEDLKRALS